MWMWLVVVLLTAAVFALYSTKRFIPGKYFFPGNLLPRGLPSSSPIR